MTAHIISFLVLVSVPALAQVGRQPSLVTNPAPVKEPAPTLTLSESLQKAMEYSLEMKSAESQRRAADEQFRLARSYILPQLDAVGSAGALKPSGNLGGPSARTVADDQYAAKLQLSQPLYVGGALDAGLAAARLNRDLAETRLFETKQNYAFTLIDTYMQAAQFQLLTRLAQDNRNVLKRYADITRGYTSIGRAKPTDRLVADSSYNLSEAEVLESESQLEQNLQNLYRLTGLSTEQATQLQTQWPLPKEETASAQSLYEKALSDNPTLKALALQAENLRQENRVRMAEYRPRLSLDGAYGYQANSTDRWFQTNAETYSVFVNLTVPLFSGFGSLAQSAINTEAVYQVERTLEIRRREVQAAIASNLVSLRKESARLRLTQLSFESAKKAMDVALRDYRNGLLSITDVLNIQRTRYDANKQFAAAQFSYLRLDLGLKRHLGIDLQQSFAAPGR